jgi:hypothetical protein
LRSWAWISVALLIWPVCSCKEQPKTGRIEARVESRTTEEPAALSFGLKPFGKQSSDHWRYAAFYSRNGKTAHFQIELRVLPGHSQENRLGQGIGSIIADPKSEQTTLLDDLQTVLKADTKPGSGIHVRELPFRFEIIVENLERGTNGRPIDTASGEWVSTRLYVGPQQDKEVVLNFMKSGGTAEILKDDATDGNAVLVELAKVP